MLETGDRKYVSNKGTPFEITIEGGLFTINMKKGGKCPPICKQRYTSFMAAEKELEIYLARTDRLGYAIYPSKERNAQS